MIVRIRENFTTGRGVINCRNRAITLTAPGCPDGICGVLSAAQTCGFVPLSSDAARPLAGLKALIKSGGNEAPAPQIARQKAQATLAVPAPGRPIARPIA